MRAARGAMALVLFAAAPLACEREHESESANEAPTTSPIPVAHRAGPLDVRLPDDARGRVELSVGNFHAAFQLVGARPAPATADGSEIRFEDGGPDGDMWLTLSERGVEDFVDVHAGSEITYTVDVSGVHALRLAANVLELIDESGTPRIRASHAIVVDRLGQRRRATMSLPTCAHDTSAAPAHGRTFASVGVDACELRLTWDPTGLTYPVVVDPSWAAAAFMTTPHVEHTATLMPSGNVLILSIAGAEVYDAGSRSFSPIGLADRDKRRQHSATLMLDRVLIAGGLDVNDIARDDVYLIGETGAVELITPTMSAPRTRHEAALLPDQTVVLIGGDAVTGRKIDRFDGTFKAFVGTNTDDIGRYGHQLVAAGGGVYVIGGRTLSCSSTSDSVELFNPADNSLAPRITLPVRKSGHQAVALPDGRVLVTGGTSNCVPSPAAQPSVFAYDPADTAAGWVSLANMSVAREAHALTLLNGGFPLVIAGHTGNQEHASSEALRTITDASWFQFPSLGSAIRNGRAVTLLGGDVLFLGGSIANVATATDFSFRLRLSGEGSACLSGVECSTRNCVDGVCCDTPCDGTCTACAGAITGGADGECLAVAADEVDPRGVCADLGAPSCSTNGRCTATQTCALYDTGTVCTTKTCTGSNETVGTCDGLGTCVPAATSCLPYACHPAGTECNKSCTTDAGCTATAYCDADSVCVPRFGPGTACSEDRQCLSGLCTDGVCCNAACLGQCEACDTAAGVGQCLPVTGAPTGGRPACDEGAATCDRSSCDGVVRDTCAGLPGPTVVCDVGECRDNVAVGMAVCDGQGSCGAPTSDDCAPYLCNAGACATSCADASDCVVGGICSVAGACVLGNHCKNASTAVAPDGTETTCGAFTCEAGGCRKDCDDDDDCTVPLICNPTRQCVAAPESTVRDGCTCRVLGHGPAPREAPTGGLWAIAVLALTRRRRSSLQ